MTELVLNTVLLGNTGRTTTQLGFGCSSIMGGLGYRESQNILENAWQAGIRHYDIAPMYGFGDAESCFGDFSLRHRGQITLTTKFGIPPNTAGPLARMARSIVRPIIRRFPYLKPGSRIQQPQVSVAARLREKEQMHGVVKPPNSIFCAREARQSLYRSLTALKTDHIDVWLLHEFTPADIQNSELLMFMEKSVQSGDVGTFGVGTDRKHIASFMQSNPEYCPVLQYEWSVFDSPPLDSPSFRIHHRSLTNNFHQLAAALVTSSKQSLMWSRHVDADLSDRPMLAKLMLKAALLHNPEGIILFSSKTTEHIKDNVATASNDRLNDQALALYRMLQTQLEPRV